MSTIVEEEIDVREAVKNGMDLLDEKFGTNFVEQIDIERLDIGSGLNCALGQVYGTFVEGRNTLGLTHTETVRCGFDVDRGDNIGRRFAELTDAWRDALLARSA